MNTFKFVGQIKKIEDKKDRKFMETMYFDSGWMMERIKFRMVCGEGSEFLELSGGKWQDDSKNTVFTIFNKSNNSTSRETEKAQVKWEDRFKQEIVDKVPHYKKYTVDVASDKIREELTKSGDTVGAEKLAGLKSTYIASYDFACKVRELLEAGAFGDDNYVVTGTIEYSYSNKSDEGAYYRSFVPTNIYKAPADEIPGTYGKLDFYYVKEDVLGDVLENGDVPLSGYVQYYDKMAKGNYYAPVGLRIKGDKENKDGFVNMFKKLGDDSAETLVVGVNVSFFNGAEKTEITKDDFTDEQLELISWGLKTVEETIREMGGDAFGERVNYIYVDGIARGYSSGPQNPDVELNAIYAKPDGEKKSQNKGAKKPTKFDLFADDDDEI